ncbi:MAG: helix-turn-helix domain-containing protein [Leucobacter sp.]
MSRLTEEQVVQARFLRFREGWSISELAERFGVSRATVHRAVRGETWAHLPHDYKFPE